MLQLQTQQNQNQQNQTQRPASWALQILLCFLDYVLVVVVLYVLNMRFCRVLNFSFECLVSIFVMMRYLRLELMADASVATNLQREILGLPHLQQSAMAVHICRWLHDPYAFKSTLQI